MEKKYVYVLLTDTGTLFTKTIKQYTKAPYNHSSIAFDKELEEIYSFGRKHPKNPINGGFIKEDVMHGTYRSFPETKCALFEVEVDDRTIQKMRKIIEVFNKNKKHLSYNLLGVIGVALKEPLEPKGSFFCSQFVAEVFTRAGLRYWNKHPSLITPDDLRSAEAFHLIYEGYLFDYPPVKTRLSSDVT